MRVKIWLSRQHVIRFFHTSDWHLGRLLYGKSLLEDQSFALARLLDLIDARKPDALLISGDIFDRALPPEAAVQVFDRFCEEAVLKRRLPVFVIPGNHDSAERVGFGSALLRSSGLTIFSRLEEALQPVCLTGAHGQSAWVYGLPFLEPALMARFLGDDTLKTPDEVTRAMVSRMIQDSAEGPKILLAHAFVIGGESSESERDIFVGGSSTVSSEAFEGFQYVALGHLHKPQRAGAEHIRYSGSLLAYSKSEVDHIKSVTEVTLAGDQVTFEHHTLPVLRPLRTLEGRLDDLVGGQPSDDYLIIGLTDSGPVLDALARLRTVYPNVLHVARAGGYMPATLPALERARERERLSDLDLFAEFFNDVTSTPLSDDERAALIETLGEVSKT